MDQYDKGFLDGQAAGWVSVSDRLPDRELAVFREAYGKDEPFEVNVMVAGASLATTLVYDGQYFWDEDDLYPVTDWRPMPEPPERSKKNDAE